MGGTESVEVTAGIWGFLVLFGLALACWFLFRSMNAHLRRMTYREREEQAGGEVAGSASDPTKADEDTVPVDDDPIGSARH